MHIAIDARLYGLKHAGIGRYVQNMITQLSQLDTQNQYTLIVNPETKLVQKPTNTKIIKSNVVHYTLAEQTKFLRVLNQIDADLYHFPHFNVPVLFNKPYVVTIHDLLWHEKIGLDVTTLKAPVYLIKYLGYRLVLRNAVYRAKTILVPTKIVKKAIKDRFEPKVPIKVTYEAASDSFAKPAEISPGSQLQKPYIMYTGSLYPHKNVHSLVDALIDLPDFYLYIASARNVFSQRFLEYVKANKLDQKVHLLGFVPDEVLAGYYQKATALVLPSKSEGFGLTGLEAMTAGVPVICTDHPVLREIYQDAALFVKNPIGSQFAQEISKLYSKPALAKKLIQKGKNLVTMYSWDKLADQTLKTYKSVYETITSKS